MFFNIVLNFFDNKNISINLNTDINNNLLNDNNTNNNSLLLNNIINLIKNILEENRKNKTKNSDNNLNIFTDIDNIFDSNINMNKNKSSSNCLKVYNYSSNKNNNNNNYYSNVHIKAITNIKELIANNMNNNSNHKDFNDKNNNISFQNNFSIENNSNKSLIKNVTNKRRKSHIKKINGNKKILYKNETHNSSNYNKLKNMFENKSFLTTTSKKIQKENIPKESIKEKNNNDKKESSPNKNGDSKERMSLKSYIKKVRNLYILKKLSNNRKLEMKKDNTNLNLSLKEVKSDNKKLTNDITSYNNINESNKKEENSKENFNNNNKESSNNLKFIKSNTNKSIHFRNINTNNNNSNRSRKKSIYNENRNLKSKSFHSKKYNSNKNLPSINILNNLSKSKSKNKMIDSKKNLRKNRSYKVIESLSNREKSYFILSKSSILRLTERLFFCRATQNLRNILSVSSILKKNEKFLKDKLKELEEQLIECNNKIKAPFNASKTAEIAFNFILSKDEDEFKQYVLFTENEEEKKEYYNYNKILFLLFDENYENIELKNLNEKLYVLINKKGFSSIKDYLYNAFIKKKEKINIVYKIDKINSILEQSPELVNKQFDAKFCRFVLFTSFLINEIIKYGNDIKNSIELEIKTKEYIDVVSKKLELYKKKENKN